MDVKNPLLPKDENMKVNITLTLDPDIIAMLNRSAVKDGRTTSNFVNQHFRTEMDQRKENEEDIHRDTE